MSGDSQTKENQRLSRDRDHAINAIYDVLASNRILNSPERDLLAGITGNDDARAQKAAGRVALRILGNARNIRKLNWDALNDVESLIAPGDNTLSRLISYLRMMRGEVVNYGTIVTTLQKAAMASITDRNAAYSLYCEAVSQDKDFIGDYVTEWGANTYFNETALAALEMEDQSAFASDLKQALATRAEKFAKPKLNFLWSADPVFLRAHALEWLNLAPYLLQHGYGMIMLITGKPDETAQAIDDARQMLMQILRFRKQDDADQILSSITFLRMQVPDYAVNEKTFFACARYLYAATVLRAAGTPLLILDIDMSVRSLIDSFVEGTESYDFGCAFSSGLAAVYPWRRYMAGTVFINNTDAGQCMIHDIGRYVRCGLTRELSWTLDQNALCYAVEKNKSARILDFSTGPRPMGQNEIRVVFERALPLSSMRKRTA